MSRRRNAPHARDLVRRRASRRGRRALPARALVRRLRWRALPARALVRRLRWRALPARRSRRAS